MSVAVMHEIDLIPADYRHELGIKRTIRRVGLAVGTLVAAAAVAAAALSHAASTARAEVAQLNAAAASAEVERAAIDVITRQKQALEAQATLRSGLRARAPLDELMAAIGRAAVDAGVWFRSWRIERVGEVVPAAPAGAEAHFVVEPGSDGSRVRSEIVIVGRATDVGGVSALAQALGADGRFARIQVQRVARDASGDLVDFELALTAETAVDTP
jgi:hypothetical protein